MTTPLDRAARLLADADAVVVTAGAGMGVDAGLPDFRGDEGFWRAYPPYERLGLTFVGLASPATFHRDPELAWGFYGHRRALYRATAPHVGHEVLLDLVESAPLGGFVVTSNVDGQFQAAGFDDAAVWEVHGTLLVDQCLADCGQPPFGAGPDVEVDPATMRAVPPLPRCPACGGLARPNVLLFGDGGWDGVLADAQQQRFRSFLADVAGSSIVVVECGAGTTLPTIRRIGEQLQDRHGARLVRINPRESDGPRGTTSISLAAAEALDAITDLLPR